MKFVDTNEERGLSGTCAPARRTRQVNDTSVRFNDGAGYEELMGRWSQLAGQQFLDWLCPEPGRSWLDVGCGNGAFTELVVQRCEPGIVHGIDPSVPQIEYARARPGAAGVEFHVGDGMHLPFPDGHFDIVVSALVLFFVPDPVQSLREMVRVTKPGGIVATYLWNFPGRGFPLEPILAAFRSIGREPPGPPHPEVSAMPALRELWSDAGLTEVRVHEISVQRGFPTAEAFWTSIQSGGSTPMAINALSDDERNRLKRHFLESFPVEGPLSPSASANAVSGRVPHRTPQA
ncbi:MAG: methyltransferase domain-containing protein [Alsobacter sp.]